MDFSWQPFDEPDSDAELRGVVGLLHPVRYRTVPRVMWHTRRIESQLARSDGLVGYALRAQVLERRFWAVAVWEDEDSLEAFVNSAPHVEIKAAMKGDMEESWFEPFAATGEEIPIDLDEAIARVR